MEVVLSSRTQGERADLREEAQVLDLFERVERRGPIDVAIFNPGANFRASILDTPAEMFEKVWRLGCYAGFLFGREAARRSLRRSRRRKAACGSWRSPWPASSGRRTFTWRTSSSTG
jgi:NAD(P)-dependent dehydrogenase (short-subunit alcohol dehydrogenase family)